jgi:glycine betaine/proline transport system ATP-binding protein
MAAPAIECRGVWKVFGPRAAEAIAAMRAGEMDKREVQRAFGCVVGVADASFRVERGEIFCIMGLSGSGKSTLVRQINGLVPATEGEVLIDGVSLAALGPEGTRRLRSRKIGMVFQAFGLLPHRNVLENAAFGLELRRVRRAERLARAREALAAMQLADWAEARIDQLSGGMQQRVGIARALAGDPDILLMDEPFSALDPLIRRQLQDQFLNLARRLGKTTVFITHDLDEAMRLGSRIAIMRDGRILQIGTPQEIVMAPADAHVAAFVGGVSARDTLRCRDVMARLEPADAGRAEGLPRVPGDMRLGAAARIAGAEARDLAVVDGAGRVIGVLPMPAILTALARGAEAADA